MTNKTPVLYNCTKAIASGNFKDYFAQTVSKPAKTFAKQSLETSVKGLKSFGKVAGKIGIKASYPVLGNLSESIQGRIEEHLGKDVYDANWATLTSLATNCYLYANAVHLFESSSSNFTYGIALGCFEALCRGAYSYEKKGQEKLVVASPIGKIVSLPIEAMLGVYDGRQEKNKISEKLK